MANEPTEDDEDEEISLEFTPIVENLLSILEYEFQGYFEDQKELAEETPGHPPLVRSDVFEDWASRKIAALIIQSGTFETKFDQIEEKLKSLGLG